MDFETSQGPFAEPTGDVSGIDADALMSQVESGQPITNPATPATAAAPSQSTPTPAAAPAEIQFNWNGKPIKLPANDPRLTQWASQGYDYSQRMQAFKAEQDKFQAQQQALKALEERYRPVEEYAEKNPQWWETVQSQYQAAIANAQPGQGTGADPNAIVGQVLQALSSKLGPMEQFIQGQQAKEIAAQRQSEDQKLESDIKSIRDTYADLDWASPDAQGMNLELRVLAHAEQNGISNFRAAFRDYFHDQLVKRAEDAGKEALVKERQKQTKLGLLGQTSTPTKGIKPADNHRAKNYDQLIREGVEELGLSLSG